MIRVAVVGASGRMGRALLRAVAAAEDLVLAQALVRPGSELIGCDAGELAGLGELGVAVGSDLAEADVAIEFVGPTGFGEALDAARRAGVALVSGSTGLDASQGRMIAEAGEVVPVLHAPNMSLGMQWVYQLVAQTARALGTAADIEILDLHHAGKRDSPSGTALALARRAAEARGQEPDAVIRSDRKGEDEPRAPGEIGVFGLRGGDVIGEHTIFFGLAGERIELTHRATSREVFVHGALAATRFLAGRKPGVYGLADLLDPGEAATG